MGGAAIISAAQSIFTNGLVNPPTAAGFAEIDLVISTGNAGLQGFLPPEQLATVMSAYMEGLRQAWALTTACVGLVCTKIEDIRNAPTHKTKESVVVNSNKNDSSAIDLLECRKKGTSS